MDDLTVRRAPLPFWLGGLLLGLTQIVAFGVKKPLGVSTQFAIISSIIVNKAAPEYANSHPLMSTEKYQTIGYGFWLDVGLAAGAAAAALALGSWKLRTTTVWTRANNRSTPWRLVTGFIGGFFILMGARMAYGCTSGQFASGWAQLSVSVLPFTAGMFAFGMATAYLVYPKSPKIEI